MLVNIQLDKYHCPIKYATLLLPLGREKFAKITYRSEKNRWCRSNCYNFH